MDFHECANIFPMMDGTEYSGLVLDIQANGLLEPIVIYDGKILDGRNRYRACMELGIEPDFEQANGNTDPKQYVISKNFHRRHLSKAQQVGIMRQLRTDGKTYQEIADITNVGVGTAYRHTSDIDLFQMEKVEGRDGKHYPASYTKPDGERGIVRNRSEERNGIATCGVCGNLYDSEALGYCPYCAYTPAQRIAYLEDAQKKPHVSNNSGENEWYTPPEYIAAAVAVMGRIDIDPASSDKANETVKASRYYTKDDDGLSQIWAGKVWMNPPYARGLIDKFTAKYAEYVTDGYISEGIVLVNNATETNWFMELVNVSDAIVFTKGRIKFMNVDLEADGKPLQGQALIYSGKNPDGFLSEFLQFGWGARL
jgi:ParB family chromosome partitioning protein